MTPTPPTLARFNAYQDEYYQRLMQLPYFKQMSKVLEDFLYRIVSDGAFYLRVPVRVLPDIIRTGQIRSMAETGRGTTNGGMETRKQTVKALFGCDADALQPEEFPKFGYLSQADSKRDLLVNSELCFQYGSVAFKLKKERMMQRTTLCVGDSVNFGRCHTLIPTRTSRIRATCIHGLTHSIESGHPIMAPADPLACYVYMTIQILEKKLTAANFPLIDRLIGDQMPVFEFFELQYHGPIDLRTDIERIDCIPCMDDDLPTLLQAQAEFQKMGIECYVRNHEE